LLSNDVVAERKTSAKNEIRIVMAKRLYNVMSRKQEKTKAKKSWPNIFFCVSKSIFFLAGAKREKKN
jgi:hypothetical protein